MDSAAAETAALEADSALREAYTNGSNLSDSEKAERPEAAAQASISVVQVLP